MLARGFRCQLLVCFCCLLLPLPANAGAYEDMLGAVQARDVEKLSQLLRRGMDVNTTDPAGNSLIMLAARNGDFRTLEYLLKNNPNLHKQNKYGESAMLLAAFAGSLQSVKALVEAGAEIDPDGWTPLIYAAFEGHAAVVRYLLTLDIDIDAQSDTGITALMAACRNNRIEIVRILLEQDADLDLQNQSKQTALDLAVSGGYTDIVALLGTAGKQD